MKYRVPMTLFSIFVLVVACALFRLFVPGGKEALSDAGAPIVEARVDECRADWMTELTSSLHWPFSATMRRGRVPMAVKNGRRGSLTLSLIPARSHRRSSWTIPPGLTWRSHTDIGQRWLFADHGRCLFYVTAGDEPLHMVVRSAS
jgi:hypothetical protein